MPSGAGWIVLLNTGSALSRCPALGSWPVESVLHTQGLGHQLGGLEEGD